MLVYRIIREDGSGLYYTGQTEAAKQAREDSKDGSTTMVYEFATPKVIVDKKTFLDALNQDAWCEPKLVARFEAGKTKKV